MNIGAPCPHRFPLKVGISADLAVVGGGMAGTCCAITAARAGLRVVLVQDRPVLGGNGSSEIRLWLLGATVHMGSNNRWAREGGVVNEIMMENLWRNPEGNPLIFDTILLEKVCAESNITLLLNTACHEVVKQGDRISGLAAYCSQNETRYEVEARLFCDASGDGVVGFLAGAAFRMGAETREEFGELFAPTGEFGHLLGHSIYFYSKDTGVPVKFHPPSFALKNIEGVIPRHRMFNAREHGCNLWWIEWGGRLDTVHETENIKWELWKVVYGVWDYIKNSGKFPEAETLTLEWVGHIPGKRESRRFEGDYMLRQQDLVERRLHPDAVAFGGWSIDLHPADGVFAEIAGSHHLHAKGIYQIPYRCYYSRNVDNLFLAGRIISASHVAFGSIRVMATCALGGQAVAEAAALCVKHGELPRDIGRPERMAVLQRALLRAGHFIPGLPLTDEADLVPAGKLTASSELVLAGLPADGPLLPLDREEAQMLPLRAGRIPRFTLWFDAAESASLRVELRTTSDPRHHTPDTVVAATTIDIPKGKKQPVVIGFDANMPEDRYAFLFLPAAPGLSFHASRQRVSGLLRVRRRGDERNAANGGEDFDVFTPVRRPGGENFALEINPPLAVFAPDNVLNGWARPTHAVNAWVADPDDDAAALKVAWEKPQRIARVVVGCDGDFDHSMETVLWGHPERAVVFCLKKFELLDDAGRRLALIDDNHQSLVTVPFETPFETRALTLRIIETWGAPAAVFEFRCYSELR